MAYQKKVNKGKTGPKEGKKVKIKKSKNNETDIWIEFDQDSDANTYTVEALDVIIDSPKGNDKTKLPFEDAAGNPITWLNAFQVKRGNDFLAGVEYSVLFDKSDVSGPDNALYPFVYHDGKDLHTITPTADPEDPKKVKIRLNTGDPAVGISKTN